MEGIPIGRSQFVMEKKEGFTHEGGWRNSASQFDNIYMSIKNSPKIYPIFILFLALALFVPPCYSQCCLSFTGGTCISCPSGMHLFRGNCLYDLTGCASYVGGFDCGGCRGNYQLANGSCWHARFPTGVANTTNFTVYLQSALQPDPSMTAAQDALTNSTQMWIDWYGATLRASQTYLNSRSLTKTASQFMRNVTASSKIHYIFTGTAGVPGSKDPILLYRFVYELSLGGGFADCLVGVEMLEGKENYIELIEVKLKRVEEAIGWTEVHSGAADELYILNRLTSYFPKITGYGYLKGFSREVDEGVNYTMFFMSNDQGVLSFVYLADKEELPPIPSTNATNKPTETIINPAQTPNTSTPSTPSSQNVPSNKQTKQTKQNNTTKSIPPNEPTPEPSPTPKNSSLPEMAMNTTNVNSNPIFAAGYAVIMQQYGLSPSCIVQQLFSISASTTVYGFYLQDAQVGLYFRFAFTIDLNYGVFEIVNYTQSSQPLITVPSPSPSPANNGTKSNTKQADNKENSTPSNPSRQNSTIPLNSSSSSIPISQFCGKEGAEYIDITNKQTSDLFLPKINLLLHAMYDAMLTNTRIESARYRLALDPQASTSTITYQISYVNAQGSVLNFQVAIVNNEFQLVSFPNTTSTESPGTTAQGGEKASNVSETIQLNASSEGKAEKPLNDSEGSKVEGDSKNKTDGIVKNKEGNESAPITPQTSQPIKDVNPPQDISNNSQTSKKTSDVPAPPIPSPPNPQRPPLPPTANNETSPKTASNNTSTPVIITIPAKNFTTQPRYKSLITILRSIYRIPANATVVSMEMWNDTAAGDSKYQIIFKMGYAARWGDGNVAKVSNYNLSVNPSSFVSVHSERIEFIKETPPVTDAPPPTSIPTPTPPIPDEAHPTPPTPPLPSPPPAPPASNTSLLSSSPSPSLALLGTNPSPYLKNLYQIFTRHSPVLNGYSLQSLNSTASNTSGAIISYSQKLQFSKQGKIICFSVWYEAASLKNGPPGSSNEILINIIEYHAIGCGTNPSPSPPPTANFTDQTNFNLAINTQLQSIAHSHPVTFSLYQRAQSYYLIRFQAVSFGQREILIDSASLLILRYLTSSKPVYSSLNRNNSVISGSIADALRANMEKIFRLGTGSLLLEWMGKSNEDEVMLLEVLGRSQVQSSWAVPVYQHFAMRAVYWPSENYIKIVGASALGLSSGQYTFNLTNAGNWTLIRPTSTFTDPAFAAVLPSLASSYTGFLQNAQIVAIYRESSSKNTTLSQYLSSQTGARLLVGISKRFSDSHEAGYLLTIRYFPSSNQTHIENIESVALSSILLNGCLVTLQGERLPQCRTCLKGYRLTDGLCFPEIEGCMEYGESYCLKCKEGLLISKDLRSCVSAKTEEALLFEAMGAFSSLGGH